MSLQSPLRNTFQEQARKMHEAVAESIRRAEEEAAKVSNGDLQNMASTCSRPNKGNTRPMCDT